MSYPAQTRREDVTTFYRMRPRTYDDVARAFGITRERVRQILNIEGTERWSSQDISAARQAERDARVRRLWDEGLTRDEIASRTSLARTTVDRCVTRVVEAGERYDRRAQPDRTQDEELLDELRACAAALGRTPGQKAFDGWMGYYRAQLLVTRWGTWAEACRAAGLEPNRRPPSPRVGQRRYSDKDVRRAYVRISDSLGTEFVSHLRWDRERTEDEPAATTVRNRYAHSWRRFIHDMRAKNAEARRS